jgi:hypothetical protein
MAKHAPQRANYKHTLPHYAKVFSIPEATARKYWRKRYPLDNPKELLEAILAQKSKGSRTNLKTLQAMAHMTKTPGPGEAPPDKRDARRSSAPRVSAPRASTQSEQPPTDALEGLQREMQRLQEETNAAYESYQDCDQPLDKQAYWKIWKEMLEQWGKLAKVAPEAEREAGKMALVTDVEATWRRLLAEAKTTLMTLPRRLATNPVFRALNPVDVEQTALAEVNQVMTALEAA